MLPTRRRDRRVEEPCHADRTDRPAIVRSRRRPTAAPRPSSTRWPEACATTATTYACSPSASRPARSTAAGCTTPAPEPMGETLEAVHVQRRTRRWPTATSSTTTPPWGRSGRRPPATTPVVVTCHGVTAENAPLYADMPGGHPDRDLAASAPGARGAVPRGDPPRGRPRRFASATAPAVTPVPRPDGAGEGGRGRDRIAREAACRCASRRRCASPASGSTSSEFVEPLLGPDVEFLGEIGPEERERQLGGAVALLNPITWAEPFGLVMIEAMVCGTPVISYPHGAAPEIVHHGRPASCAPGSPRRPMRCGRAACSIAPRAERTSRRFSPSRMVGLRSARAARHRGAGRRVAAPTPRSGGSPLSGGARPRQPGIAAAGRHR